jgi:hypothetical protein
MQKYLMKFGVSIPKLIVLTRSLFIWWKLAIFLTCGFLYPDGMFLMEVDRVLRPGGYWILSGPPINWKTYYQTWKRSKADLQAEQRRIEELAESLCWEKKYEKGDIAIFRKKANNKNCRRKSASICESKDADDVW